MMFLIWNTPFFHETEGNLMGEKQIFVATWKTFISHKHACIQEWILRSIIKKLNKMGKIILHYTPYMWAN